MRIEPRGRETCEPLDRGLVRCAHVGRGQHAEQPAARDPVAWLSLNREFHTRLYTPAQRPRILRFADNLRMMMDRYLRLHLGVLQRFDVADREHRDILTAYHERDSHLACKYVEAHLLRTADSVVTFLAKRGK